MPRFHVKKNFKKKNFKKFKKRLIPSKVSSLFGGNWPSGRRKTKSRYNGPPGWDIKVGENIATKTYSVFTNVSHVLETILEDFRRFLENPKKF